jgi:hypothetical protein
MTRDIEQEGRHKVLVLEAFDALFNRRDSEAAKRYWSPGYLQHSAGIGRPFRPGSRRSSSVREVGWPSPRATTWFYTAASLATVSRGP